MYTVTSPIELSLLWLGSLIKSTGIDPSMLGHVGEFLFLCLWWHRHFRNARKLHRKLMNGLTSVELKTGVPATFLFLWAGTIVGTYLRNLAPGTFLAGWRTATWTQLRFRVNTICQTTAVDCVQWGRGLAPVLAGATCHYHHSCCQHQHLHHLLLHHAETVASR